MVIGTDTSDAAQDGARLASLLHRELYYLSDRLAGDLVEQTKAKKRLKLRPGLGVGVPPVSASLTLASEEPVSGNRHALAEEALKAAADEAGTLAYPGRYIHVRDCAYCLWVFSFKGHRVKRPIALAMIEHEDTLAILIGSPGNVFGFRQERPIDGWIPSDPGGLHYLAQYTSESDLDAKTAAQFRPEQVELQAKVFCEDPPDLIVDAASIAASINRTPDQAGRADVLAKVFTYRDDVVVPIPPKGFSQRFWRVIVGAAVFVREPAPTPLL